MNSETHINNVNTDINANPNLDRTTWDTLGQDASEMCTEIEAKIKNPEKLRLGLEKLSNLSFPQVPLLVN